MKTKLFSNLVLSSSIIFFITVSIAIEDDVKCLEGVKHSLADPEGKLTWSFTNTSVSFICKLVGVTCWNEKESRFISLQLPTMGLGGQLPASLQYCRSLQTLDLSGNDLSGSIPPQICTWLPYLVFLDLSGNRLSGSIPPEMVNCKFLNNLVLNDNKLSGSIPYELGRLDRLKQFSVANNQLSGPIPSDLSKFQAENFGGNNGLCGKPLGSKCGGLSNKSLAIIIAAGVLGAAGSLLLGFALRWWFFVQPNQKKKKGYGEEKVQSSWVERLKAHKLVQVSLFQKPIVKVKLNDLMAATNNFDPENIIINARTGVSYKAMLSDGSALAIKRLNAFEDEKLLVYKHMPNGTLYSLLHGSVTNCLLDWPSRLRIGVGAARGLAWLHHGCQPPYLHQNISSNVILVDDDFDARITDFGMARLIGSVDSNDSSFVNGDLGEFGYVAPEYVSTMIASMKGDVYGFGVVLLELVTGQKPLDVSNAEEGFKGNLVDWVNQLSSLGRSKDAIDEALCGKGHDDDIMQLLKIACTCVISRPKDRPSMYNVYQSLKSMAEEHGFSEHFDEFPLNVGKQDLDNKERGERTRRGRARASSNSPPLLLFLLLLVFASFHETSSGRDRREGAGGRREERGLVGRRVLMSFKETPSGGNVTFECSPWGPCIPSLYSEKNDEKYRCSETGYRIPFKCVEIRAGSKDADCQKTHKSRSALENTHDNAKKTHVMLHDAEELTISIRQRHLLDDSSTLEGGSQTYITYRSCIVNKEKLSLLGFKGIIVFAARKRQFICIL
ncbi:hypothetical protein F0562_033405 [Nyssa sinensis]|uniref:Protein kinase domain-containing protein n=1 Tax=Nyssa sinensis TaxID=561372 RepID=A0A5J5ATP1_9ASTE|nr:hypothetical protein F0562_033405 [Nyssa sinensis]